MTFSELKEKALSLPYEPGVYIMRDAQDTVIYVGKAKKLKNRVSQYFQDTASHTQKTRMMVSKIHHFDVIVAASEFEALVLECAQIKRYMPKYNILLKDDKGYPYLRLDLRERYPRITLVNQIQEDGAEYFGPFGSRGVTNHALEAIEKTLRLPTCGKKFPRDTGKGRPCLNYHMGDCDGWCRDEQILDGYGQRIRQARRLLMGDYKAVAAEIRGEMIQAADAMQFEIAASLRDRLNAVEALGMKQTVVAGKSVDIDAIGFSQLDTKACFSVLHFSGGDLVDKEYEILSSPEDAGDALSSLVKQYYLTGSLVPKLILLPVEMEDAELFCQLLREKHNKKTCMKVPQRGENLRLLQLAQKNAQEELHRITDKEERLKGSLHLLSRMLAIPVPSRMEAYDISNISGTDIVGSMVVFQDGKPKKKDYRHFRIDDFTDQNDYGSMQQVLRRRFSHYTNQDAGFQEKPDLLLIDGGISHANAAWEVLKEFSLDIPVFGMVKDDRHRTRALVTPDGREISISAQQSVYALIGTIQEETHRFAITYHRKLRSQRIRKSVLDQIPGVGEKRKQQLLKQFGSIGAIQQASLGELERLLPGNTAASVYRFFHPKEDPSCE